MPGQHLERRHDATVGVLNSQPMESRLFERDAQDPVSARLSDRNLDSPDQVQNLDNGSAPLRIQVVQGRLFADIDRLRRDGQLLEQHEECQMHRHGSRDASLSVVSGEVEHPPKIEDLGRRPYDEVLQRMRSLHTEVCGGAPGRILLVEHEPVYTAGRATPSEQLGPHTVEIERGGQITYHGPGQLVVYPIIRLPRRDVRDWLRRLERFGVEVCRRFGLSATPSLDGTGVFIGTRKVASIGVAIKRWVNLHGIGINVAMDLGAWQCVRPCGRDPEIMSDLSTAAARPIMLDEARDAVRASVFLLHDPADRL